MDKGKLWGSLYNYTFIFVLILMVSVFVFDVNGILYDYIFTIIVFSILISFVFLVLYGLTFFKKKWVRVDLTFSSNE